MVDKTQRRSAIHYAAAAGQIGVLRALLSDSQLMHTEEGVMPLKNVRVHDMSGQCRYPPPPLTPLIVLDIPYRVLQLTCGHGQRIEVR